MSDDEILDLIKEALCEVAPQQAASFANLTLASEIKDLNIDSILRLEMVGFIEDRLARIFDEHDLACVNNLGDIASLIRGIKLSCSVQSSVLTPRQTG